VPDCNIQTVYRSAPILRLVSVRKGVATVSACITVVTHALQTDREEKRLYNAIMFIAGHKNRSRDLSPPSVRKDSGVQDPFQDASIEFLRLMDSWGAISINLHVIDIKIYRICCIQANSRGPILQPAWLRGESITGQENKSILESISI
jgi:hypothetical protein